MVWNELTRHPGGIYEPDGSRLLSIGAGNPEIGKPKVTFKCRPDATSDPNSTPETHSFAEGETYSFTCNPYRVEATREPDSEELEDFTAMVTRR